MDDSKWEEVPSRVADNPSASFLAWLLLETEEAAAAQALFHRRSQFAARFAQIYGRSLEQAETEWKRYLRRVEW